jgi:hypothetical protein
MQSQGCIPIPAAQDAAPLVLGEAPDGQRTRGDSGLAEEDAHHGIVQGAAKDVQAIGAMDLRRSALARDLGSDAAVIVASFSTSC